MEERGIQLVAGLDTSDVQEGLNQIERQAEQMAQGVARAGEQAERGMEGVGRGAGRSSQNVEAAQRNLIGSIQRTTAAMEAGSRSSSQYYEVLARQRGIDPNILAPYLTQLRAVEAAQGRANAALGSAAPHLNDVGMSARATAAALRGVPAQLTDIITSLQGGQAPLTVFLQQGGQLRDMFGSAGGAARALGGYVAGLITPTTVAAAAAAALGIAHYKGTQEADAYSHALIMSGNAAGATVGQLSDMARQIGAISGSQGAGAEALAALTATGKVSADNLQRFATVAIDVQRVLGRSVADTASEFAELGKAPLQALDKLNEKYHFVTAATYAQVKALQDQGRAAEAADVAQKAYADGISTQRQKVMDSLSDWERGWIRIKNAASGALDAAIDAAMGRQETNVQKITKALAERELIEKRIQVAVSKGDAGKEAQFRKDLAANETQINGLRGKEKAQRDAAKAEADAAKIDDARTQWLKDADKYLPRQAQMERDIAKARNEGAAANLSSTEIEKRVADVRKSYADIFNAGIDSNIEALKRRDAVQDVLTQREVARIAAARAAGSMTEDASISATAEAEIKAFERKRGLLEQELALTKGKANSIKEQAALEGEMAVLDEQRTSRKIQLTSDLFALEQKRYRLAVENTANLIEAGMAERNSLVQQTQAQLDYNEQIGLTKKQIGELTAIRLRERAARKDEEADIAEGFDLDGRKAQIIRDQAQALRDRANAAIEGGDKEFRYDQFKQAVDQYSQVFQTGFADMLNHGRDGWKSFTRSLVTTFKTSVADQIYKMFAKPFVVQMVGSFLGMSQEAIAKEIAGSNGGTGNSSDGASSSAIGAAQTASSLYKAISGGFDKLGSTVANGYDTLAGQFGPGTIGSTGASGTGAAIGGYVQAGAGALAGHYIGNAIAGDYSVAHGQTVTNVASIIGAIVGGPIGGAIGGAIGGLINRAFGMGPKEVTAAGMRGTLSSGGLTGTNYSNWHQNGGFFRSDKNGSDLTAFSADLTKQFTQGFDAIKSASSGFAASLGVSADSIKDYAKTFDIALGKDQAANEKAITDFFTGLGDEIAKKLVPSLDDLSKSGESASAALQRLAGDFQATDQMAQLIGKSAKEVFGSVGIESAKARERLIDLAGGASVLGQQAAFFAQNFLTDAQRLKPVQEALEAAMASLGLSSVKTREQFSDVIRGLDLTTESGAKQFASMMKLTEAFAQVHPVIDATVDSLQAMKDAAGGLLGDVDNAFSVLQKVVDREKSAIQSRIDLESKAIAKHQALADALRSTLDAIAPMDRASAQAQIKSALAIAKAGGPLPDADSLKKALSAVSQDASSQFSSYTDYLRDLASTLGDIDALAGITDKSLTTEQKSLDALNGQLSRLDAIVANGQSQIDALNGVGGGLLTLAQAMAGLQTALGSAKANPVVSATSGISGLYQSLLGRAPDAAGLDYWKDKAAGGMSMDAIAKFFKESTEYRTRIPGFANGGNFAGGVRMVGEIGPEVEFTGPSRIASYNALMSRLSAPSDNSAALAAAVERLTREVEGLRTEARATATHSEKTARLLQRVIREDTLVTSTEPA